MKLSELMKEVSKEIWEKIGIRIEADDVLEENTMTAHLWERIYKAYTFETTAAKRKHMKPENKSGADLEWWILDPETRRVIALRIQAKIISAGGRSYPQLNHKVDGKYQTDILLHAAMNEDKMIPLYFFYNFFKRDKKSNPSDVGLQYTYAQNIKKVKQLKPNQYKQVKYLRPYQLPLHLLFGEKTDIVKILSSFATEMNLSKVEKEKFLKEYDQIPDYIQKMLKKKGYITIHKQVANVPTRLELYINEFFGKLFRKLFGKSIEKCKKIYEQSRLKSNLERTTEGIIKSAYTLERKYRLKERIDTFLRIRNEKKAKGCVVDFPEEAPQSIGFILITQITE